MRHIAYGFNESSVRVFFQHSQLIVATNDLSVKGCHHLLFYFFNQAVSLK